MVYIEIPEVPEAILYPKDTLMGAVIMTIISFFFRWPIIARITFVISLGTILYILGYRIWLIRRGNLFFNENEMKILSNLRVEKVVGPTKETRLLQFTIDNKRYGVRYNSLLDQLDNNGIIKHLQKNFNYNNYQIKDTIEMVITKEEKTNDLYVGVYDLDPISFGEAELVFLDMICLIARYIENYHDNIDHKEVIIEGKN